MSVSEDGALHWHDWMEKRVCVKGTMFGTLKYVGKTEFCNGLWCGIALDNPFGKNDGMVNNIRYFTCEPNFGIFVPHSKVTKMEEPCLSIKREMDLNETFEIGNTCVNNVRTYSEEKSYVCEDWVDEAIEVAKNKLSAFRKDSEESLGILNPDLIDDLETSFEFLVPDKSNNDLSLKGSILAQKNEKDDFSFIVQSVASPTENVFADIISNPKYASTPRHPTAKQFIYCESDLKNNLVPEVNQIKSVFEESAENCTEIFFDTNKFENNPNLTSTSKRELGLAVMLSNSMANLDQLEKDNFENLNKTQTLSSQCKGFVKEKEVFNMTFKLTDADLVGSSLNESEELLNTNNGKFHSNVYLKNINENKNCETKQKENLTELNFNLNSTFELKCSDNAFQKLPTDTCKNNIHLKMNGTPNLHANVNKNDLININANKFYTNTKLDDIKEYENESYISKSYLAELNTNLNNTFELKCDNVSQKFPVDISKSSDINLKLNEILNHCVNKNDLENIDVRRFCTYKKLDCLKEYENESCENLPRSLSELNVNLNSTFDLKSLDTSQKLPIDKNKSSVNLKMNKTPNLCASTDDSVNKDANKLYRNKKLDDIKEYENEDLKENISELNANLNNTFELKCVNDALQKLPINICENSVVSSKMNETLDICTSVHKEMLENTFILDSSPVKELCVDSEQTAPMIVLRDESVNLKSKTKFSTRKSMYSCATKNNPLRFKERTFDSKETFLKHNKNISECSDMSLSRKSKSAIDFKNSNLLEKANDEFKKPLNPNSKFVSKSHSTNSKERNNSLSSKEVLDCPKRSSNLPNLQSNINSNETTSENVFKMKFNKADEENKSKKNSTYALRSQGIPKISSIQNSSKSNLSKTSGLFSQSKTKGTSQPVLHSNDYHLKEFSKTMPVENIIKPSKTLAHPNCKVTNVNPDSKELNGRNSANEILKPQLKVPTANNTLNANKRKVAGGIIKPNFHFKENSFPMQPKIARRNSLVISPKSKLPADIKRRYSVLPTTFNKEKIESTKVNPSLISCLNTEKSLSKLNVQSVSKNIQCSSNCSSATEKKNSNLRPPSVRKSISTSNIKFELRSSNIKEKRKH